MIDDVVRELSPDGSLEALYASDAHELDELAESADLLIVDFGLDATLEPRADARPGRRGTRTSLLFPEPLRPVVMAFERLVEQERARLDRGCTPGASCSSTARPSTWTRSSSRTSTAAAGPRTRGCGGRR